MPPINPLMDVVGFDPGGHHELGHDVTNGYVASPRPPAPEDRDTPPQELSDRFSRAIAAVIRR